MKIYDFEWLADENIHPEWIKICRTMISVPVSYTHLRAHETVLDLVCRLLLEKKKTNRSQYYTTTILHKHTQ